MKEILDYYIKHADERFERFEKNTSDRLDRMENKIDKLNSWKWQVVGGASVVIFLFGLVVRIYPALLK